MKPHYNRVAQKVITPEWAFKELKSGNKRFCNDESLHKDLMTEVHDTSHGQAPFATILHCIDSRVSAEFIFDQGVGDIFSVRIAGNIENDDILGSLEFATALAGTKLILVLGHTSCGAVKGACDHAELGNLTGLLRKIEPAIKAIKEPADEEQRNSKNIKFVNNIATENVRLTIENIRLKSTTIADLENQSPPAIQIIGGMYDISNGVVTFYKTKGDKLVKIDEL